MAKLDQIGGVLALWCIAPSVICSFAPARVNVSTGLHIGNVLVHGDSPDDTSTALILHFGFKSNQNFVSFR